MTIEELLGGMLADEIEKLKGPDLIKYFGHYLPITRPELARQSRGQESKPRQLSLLSPEEQAKKKKIKDILADLGIDDSDMDI